MLHRYSRSYETRPPVFCQFCDRPFTRSDALSRHLKTCRTRLESGAPIPNTHRARGKKRKACDRCVRLKRACNSGLPCQTCISKNQECTYTVPDRISSLNMPSTQYDNVLTDLSCLDGLSPSYENWPVPTLSPTAVNWPCEILSIPSQNTRPCSRFEFLARHTDSKGLMDSFNCRIGRTSTSKGGFSYTYTFDASQFALDRMFQKHWTVSPDSLHDWAIHPLAFETHQIVMGLKETIRRKPRRSAVTLEWSPIVERMCFHFFSPPNLCRYLDAFWSAWYPNCPIIHKPSFNPAKASPFLLASMAIIGSCLLERQDHQNAEMWFDAVEEMVFDAEFLQEDADASLDDAEHKSQTLQALQAAYLVCIFQNWEGSETTKRRIRRRRYSTVVAVARDLVQSSDVHQAFWLMNDTSDFDLKAYIQTEETIRTLSYVFLLDTAFVIFHNTPPRIFGSELEIHIACPEVAFQAGSTEECFQHLKKWADGMLHHPSISSTIETLCQPNTEVILDAYTHLGLLNMFVIISAFCVSIYQLQNSLATPTAFENIKRGTQNWKTAWDKMHALSILPDENAVDDSVDEAWRRVGFMKSASEYWLLCNVLLESIQQSDAGKTSSVAKRTLGKYDTDMGQLRQLITQFNAMKM